MKFERGDMVLSDETGYTEKFEEWRVRERGDGE